jgi:hypothetical protein
VDVMLVAQIRNGFAFNQMLAKNRDLLLRTKVTSVVVVHRGLFFRPRLAHPQQEFFRDSPEQFDFRPPGKTFVDLQRRRERPKNGVLKSAIRGGKINPSYIDCR